MISASYIDYATRSLSFTLHWSSCQQNEDVELPFFVHWTLRIGQHADRNITIVF